MADKVLSQEEIDRLLAQLREAGGAGPDKPAAEPGKTDRPGASSLPEGSAGGAAPAGSEPLPAPPAAGEPRPPYVIPTVSTPVQPFFRPGSVALKPSMRNIPVVFQVELGRLETDVRNLLGYGVGSVLKLDRPVDAPLLVRLNGRPFGFGEAVVVEERFGVRLLGLVPVEDREEQGAGGPMQQATG